MTVGVGIVFPGSNRDIDAVNGLDGRGRGAARSCGTRTPTSSASSAILLPGGFAYGDYLRAGVMARFSPVMRAVAEYAARGGLVLGICNGFQVLGRGGPRARRAAAQPRPALRVPLGARSRAERRDTPFTPRARRAAAAADARRARRGLLLRRTTRPRRAGGARPGAVALRRRDGGSPARTTAATPTARCAGSRACATPRATSPG